MAKVLLRTAWLNSNFRTMLKATIVLAKYLTWDFLVRNRKLLIPARTYKSNENATLTNQRRVRASLSGFLISGFPEADVLTPAQILLTEHLVLQDNIGSYSFLLIVAKRYPLKANQIPIQFH